MATISKDGYFTTFLNNLFQYSNHFHNKYFFPYIESEFLLSNLYPLPLILPLDTSEKSSSFLAVSLQAEQTQLPLYLVCYMLQLLINLLALYWAYSSWYKGGIDYDLA